MELKIFDRNLKLIGIIDSFNSLIWDRKYKAVGELQLNILFSDEVNSILKKGNIIYKDNGECGYITSKEITVSEDGAEHIEVKGKFMLGYLERRIILGADTLETNVIDGSYSLVDNNCISCSSERVIPNLKLGNKPNINIELIKQVGNENLLEALLDIVEVNDLGIKIDFAVKEKALVFKMYQGIDRSIHQNVYAPIIFSRNFENVLSQNYLESINNYKNVAFVVGAGEGENQKSCIIGEAKGLDRYELFVDSKDLDNKKQIENNNGEVEDVEMSDSEYIPLLETRGKEKLAEHYETVMFESTINPHSNYEYKQDYDLGDIVTFFDKKWGITLNTRITEIIETYSAEGMTLDIIFGNDVPSLMEIIKRK